MALDFDILKKFGTTNARLREVLTCTDEDCDDFDHRKKFEDRFSDRILSGIRLSLSHYHLYAAADLAWDSTPIVRENIPLMLYAQKKIDLSRCGAELEKLGCAKEFVRKSEDGTIKDIDIPRLYESSINLVRSYVTRRLAAQAMQYNHLFPFFKYAPRGTSTVGKLRADALSQRVEMLVDQYGLRHLQTQVIRDMLLYGRSLMFPKCAWESDKAWQKVAPADGFTSEDSENDDYATETIVVREGVDFVRPHPTRVFWDISNPLSSVNTDTGCRYLGFWDIVRYKDIMTTPGYFNRDKIKITDSGRDIYGSYSLYLDSTFTATQIKFTGTAGLRPVNDGMDNDRVAMEPFYNQNEADETMFVTQYFERIIPKDCGIGNYPFPLWVRFVVAGDNTVVFAEILPSLPAVYFGYNENDSRYANLSMALELVGFQDQLSNLLSQLLLTSKNNALKIVTLDIDGVDDAMRAAIKKTLAGKDYYVHPLLLEYSGIKSRNVGSNAQSPLNLIEKTSQEEISGYFRSIAQILSIVERMLVLSPQELGQAAPREISATEVSAISTSTQTVYGFIACAIDEGRAAWKKVLYESLIAKATNEIKVPVVDRYSPETIRLAGFEGDTEEENGKITSEGAQQMIVGSKQKLVHEYIFSSRDGSDRIVDSAAAQTLVQLIGQLLQVPGMIQILGRRRLYEMFNEVFRQSGAGYDLKLELQDGEPDDFGPNPEDIEAALGELSKNVQTLAEQTQQNQTDIGTIVQTIQAALGGSQQPPTQAGQVAPGVQGPPPAPITAPSGGAIPVELGLQG